MKIPASRLSEETIGGVKVIMQMSKDKNALACSRNFDYIRSKPGKKELLVMMNCMGVAKSWSENPSWMYDTDFEFLNSDDVTCLVCAGPRAYDYKLRLLLAGIPEEKIAFVHTPIGTAIKAVTPEEIAVSIAGEMICVRATRREAAGEVHHGCPMH